MLAWPITCRSHKQQHSSLLLGPTDCSCCVRPLCLCLQLRATLCVGDVSLRNLRAHLLAPQKHLAPASTLHYQPKTLLGGVLHVGLPRLLKVPLLCGRHVCH